MAEHQATRLEAARTNSLTRSEEFDHGDWVKTNVTVNADQESGPDGVLSLDELVENNDTSNPHRIEQNKTLTADATYAFSCWAIEGDREWLALSVLETGSAANRARTWFNLGTGTVGTEESNGTGSNVRSYVEDWTDAVPGLYRCVVVGSVGNGATDIDTWTQIAQSDGQNAYDGDGSSSLYAGYAQLEDQAEFASSYIPTTSSAVTRAADSLSWGIGFDPRELTVYCKFVERGTINITSARVVDIGRSGGTGGGQPYFMMSEDGSGNYRTAGRWDSNTRTANQSAAPVVGDVVELTGVLNLDGSVESHQSINGGSVTSDTSSTGTAPPSSWNEDTILVNQRSGDFIGFNDFIALVIAPGVRTMDEMRALAGTA